MSRIFIAVLFVMGTLVACGCQSSSNPWSGEAYKMPSSRFNTPQSTYAPMPSILPSVEAHTISTGTADPTISETTESDGF